MESASPDRLCRALCICTALYVVMFSCSSSEDVETAADLQLGMDTAADVPTVSCEGRLCNTTFRRLRGASTGLAAEGQIRWTNYPGKCIDVRDGEVANGARLQLWDCLESSASQRFVWSSSDGKIRWAAHPEFCVDIRDHRRSNGNRVQLWKCSDRNYDQSFDVVSGGRGRIRWSTHSDMCLDVKDHSDSNGNTIQIWTCQDHNSDQSFSFGGGSGDGGTPQPAGEAYDVIVVGGGMVGSVVAAEVAERLPGKRVLLVEAGKASQAILGGKEPPASWDRQSRRWKPWPGMSRLGLTKYDVPGNYERLQCWRRDCPESWGHAVPDFQCKVLGGCGVMNGALIQIPRPEMFDSWPAGWQHGDMAPYLQAAQSPPFDITSTPSHDGAHYLGDTGANFVKLALTRGGFRPGDTLQPAAGVVGEPQVMASGGVRQSTTSALLPKALARGNLDLMLETEVLKILQHGGTATGIQVSRAGRGRETIELKPDGVVVVSAMNTPRLLLGSGVTGGGSVGEGVSDHSLISMVYTVSDSAEPSASAGASAGFFIDPPDSAAISHYVASRSGPLAQYGPTLVAFIRHPTTTGPPDAFDVEVWVNQLTKERDAHVSIVLMRPTCSSGRLYLGSDGSLKQSGNLNIACRRDQEILDFAIGELDRWLGKLGAKRVAKSEPRTMSHFVGSCAWPLRLSEDLRVRGSSNIAVADASLVPEQVWGHPQLTLMAVGFKAAEVLAASLR